VLRVLPTHRNHGLRWQNEVATPLSGDSYRACARNPKRCRAQASKVGGRLAISSGQRASMIGRRAPKSDAAKYSRQRLAARGRPRPQRRGARG
jgi:hypothetical protein